MVTSRAPSLACPKTCRRRRPAQEESCCSGLTQRQGVHTAPPRCVPVFPHGGPDEKQKKNIKQTEKKNWAEKKEVKPKIIKKKQHKNGVIYGSKKNDGPTCRAALASAISVQLWGPSFLSGNGVPGWTAMGFQEISDLSDRSPIKKKKTWCFWLLWIAFDCFWLL